ncbi:hypothetical protein pb186bvf_004591 [Paramecium bursaria]
MQQSPLIQTEPLISSRGPGSKSPFKSYGDQMVRCNQIEQELYRVNQQRKLLAIELDELSNQFVKKSQKLQELESILEDYREKAIYAQKQEENARNQLKQRTQEMYIQTKRLNYLEQKIQDSSRLMQDLQKQNQELRINIKHQQESIRELNQDRQKLQSQLLYSQMEQEMIQFKDQKIKHLEHEKDLVTNELLKLKKDSNLGFDKYDAKSEQIKQLQLEIQNFIKTQQLQLQQIEQQSQDIQLIQNKKEKWKQRTKQLQKELDEKSSKQSEIQSEQQEREQFQKQSDVQDIQDLQEKYQQLEVENEYLREQHIQQTTKIQELTDKLLKQQLQSSYTKEQQTFSFQEQQKQR